MWILSTYILFSILIYFIKTSKNVMSVYIKIETLKRHILIMDNSFMFNILIYLI